ncbi:MAG: ribonuclease PH [Candidatus Helarchaeota archaeon]|nr:ribonuclease PH [Candidatus Helarchaeota archaeon]
MEREDKRKFDELRTVKIQRNFVKFPEGSVLIEFGDTKVLCCASVLERVPPWMIGKGSGWLTAQYSMLPRATHTRNERESRIGHIHGRTMEISRLIGRSLRAAIDLDKLGERSIYIDCDVIQADGGTRTASITGAFIALYDAITHLIENNIIFENPIKEFVAATSAGISDSQILLDLNYQEDSMVDVDFNCVMTESGKFVEIQATAEIEPFSRELLDEVLKVAEKGIKTLIEKQKEALKLI